MAKGNDTKALNGAEPGAPVKKSSRVKKIVIFLLLLIIFGVIGGGGAYWWFYLRPANPVAEDAAEAAQAAPADAGQPSAENKTADDTPRVERESVLPRSTGKVLPLPEITVNIADSSGRRKLTLGMEVEVNSDVSAEIKANNARIRDAVIMVLAGRSYADIASPEGKLMLKGEVASRLNQILGAQRVVRIYFTDFVVE